MLKVAVVSIGRYVLILRMTITAAKPSTLIGLRGAMGNVGGKIFRIYSDLFCRSF